MATDSIEILLAGWREAERSWEGSTPGEDTRAAARRVLGAWVAYQDVALTAERRAFLLVGDNYSTYVAATGGVLAVLGYKPAEMVGGRITDFASPELKNATPSQWSAFLVSGRQEGRFML